MGDQKVKALLMDTRSIQRYVFAGNRLRTNIGASYLVDRVFNDVLIARVLEGTDEAPGLFHGDLTTSLRFGEEMQTRCAVAYTGGGNALLLFRMDTDDGVEQQVVRTFSRELLATRPGFHIGAAHGILDLTSDDLFQEGLNGLYQQLKETQATMFPPVNVQYTGLTLSCEVNGEAANFHDLKGLVERPGADGPRFFSQEVAVKAAVADEASEALRRRFEALLPEGPARTSFRKYSFPMVLEYLGQKRGETRGNYIAIVHLDGNNMGNKFRLLCKSLEDRRQLADEVQRKTEGSFAVLISEILQRCEEGSYEGVLDLNATKKSGIAEGTKILPIRPLILGGDDITFICPAKMAISYTKRLMELLMTDLPEGFPRVSLESARHLDSCAGIAILPTSYPFFRGYDLAEHLAGEAKKAMRARLPQTAPEREEASPKATTPQDLTGTCWLDYAILHGEQAPELSQIRAQEYTGARGPMHFGPYQIGNTAASHAVERRHNIEHLLECVHILQQDAGSGRHRKGALPRNKIKELRNVLQRGRHEADEFMAQMRRMGQTLPQIEDWDVFQSEEAAFWNEKGEVPETPYVDAIELMDFMEVKKG